MTYLAPSSSIPTSERKPWKTHVSYANIDVKLFEHYHQSLEFTAVRCVQSCCFYFLDIIRKLRSFGKTSQPANQPINMSIPVLFTLPPSNRHEVILIDTTAKLSLKALNKQITSTIAESPNCAESLLSPRKSWFSSMVMPSICFPCSSNPRYQI
ncbi:unnamed protein product [Periconia digitata]|uniref:Uncharacterized protein n=1 Tax=Periconia digitata TaxID=1303443 RepID=A0A9W4XYZ3_9PLEO|nr:unnamed protein product [Periconia digitata]